MDESEGSKSGENGTPGEPTKTPGRVDLARRDKKRTPDILSRHSLSKQLGTGSEPTLGRKKRDSGSTSGSRTKDLRRNGETGLVLAGLPWINQHNDACQ